MIIGSCKVKLHIFSPNSLKEKRSILKSLIQRLKNKFNISIAEVGDNDLWQSAVIGFAVISNERKHVDEVINKCVDFIDGFGEVEIVDIEIEMYL